MLGQATFLDCTSVPGTQQAQLTECPCSREKCISGRDSNSAALVAVALFLHIEAAILAAGVSMSMLQFRTH